MIKVEDNLKKLGINIPSAPKPLGAYKGVVISGNIVFVSGQLPIEKGELKYKGKVGSDISLEDGVHASQIAAINILSVMKQEIGDLNKINRILKVTGYVASAPGFDMQAKVVNGASELFYQVFGENGLHARAAVGVFELPLGAPVEIEAIAEIVY